MRIRSSALAAMAVLLLVGCAPASEREWPWPTRPLTDYVLAPVQDLPSRLPDGRIVVDAVYQDVQRRIDPDSDVLVGDTVGWVVVALCADSPTSGPELTELTAAIAPVALLSDAVVEKALRGEYLDALDCPNGWWSAPTVGD